VIYEIKANNLKYGLGEHADEVAFINPSTLKNSNHRSEQLVYRFATKKY